MSLCTLSIGAGAFYLHITREEISNDSKACFVVSLGPSTILQGTLSATKSIRRLALKNVRKYVTYINTIASNWHLSCNILSITYTSACALCSTSTNHTDFHQDDSRGTPYCTISLSASTPKIINNARAITYLLLPIPSTPQPPILTHIILSLPPLLRLRLLIPARLLLLLILLSQLSNLLRADRDLLPDVFVELDARLVAEPDDLASAFQVFPVGAAAEEELEDQEAHDGDVFDGGIGREEVVFGEDVEAG